MPTPLRLLTALCLLVSLAPSAHAQAAHAQAPLDGFRRALTVIPQIEPSPIMWSNLEAARALHGERYLFRVFVRGMERMFFAPDSQALAAVTGFTVSDIQELAIGGTPPADVRMIIGPNAERVRATHLALGFEEKTLGPHTYLSRGESGGMDLTASNDSPFWGEFGADFRLVIRPQHEDRRATQLIATRTDAGLATALSALQIRWDLNPYAPFVAAAEAALPEGALVLGGYAIPSHATDPTGEARHRWILLVDARDGADDLTILVLGYPQRAAERFADTAAQTLMTTPSRRMGDGTPLLAPLDGAEQPLSLTVTPVLSSTTPRSALVVTLRRPGNPPDANVMNPVYQRLIQAIEYRDFFVGAEL